MGEREMVGEREEGRVCMVMGMGRLRVRDKGLG